MAKKKKKKKKEYKPEDFLKKYNELVKETGYRISVTPVWRYSNETRDYRMILNNNVEKTRS